MNRKLTVVLLALALTAPGHLGAQRVDPADLEIRTFRLRFMSAQAAAEAVEPYIVSPAGGVFGAGGVVSGAITVRETPRALARIDSLLGVLDHPPATVRLRFQLIAAHDEQARDDRIASLDSTLRDLFRFRGYRLLAQTVVIVGEYNAFMQSFAAEGDRLELRGRVAAVSAGADSGRVHLDITLVRPHMAIGSTGEQAGALGQPVLSTGLSIPIGQTVVLGSGVSGEKIQALILVVTPEVQGPGRR